jgi:hypothetical protein
MNMPPERLVYWRGQMLRSADFRRQQRVSAQLRAAHNMALHDVGGVRRGLKATRAETEDGTPIVKVTCGLAFDCLGRELILQRDATVPMPPGGQEGDRVLLLIRLRESENGSCCEERPTECWPSRAVSLLEDSLEFHWMDADEARRLHGVALMGLEHTGEGWADLDPGLFSAPRTRPLSRPKLASGRTIPGESIWRYWFAGQRLAGLETSIDTSSAGYTHTPHYFASLSAASSLTASGFAPPYLTHILQPTPRGFLFRIHFVSPPTVIGVAAVRSTVVDIAGASEAAGGGAVVHVADVSGFAVGDRLSAFSRGVAPGALADARVLEIDRANNILILDTGPEALSGAAELSIARFGREQNRLRLASVAGLRPGMQLLLTETLEGGTHTETARIASVDEATHTVTLDFAPGAPRLFAVSTTQINVVQILYPLLLAPILAQQAGFSVCWTACGEHRPEKTECPGRTSRPHPCDRKNDQPNGEKERPCP